MAIDPFTISAGASLLGGLFGASSAKRAAKAQQAAAREAAAVQRETFDTTRKDLAPWRNAGANALDRLSFLLGTGSPASYNPAVSQAQAQYDQALQKYNALASAPAQTSLPASQEAWYQPQWSANYSGKEGEPPMRRMPTGGATMDTSALDQAQADLAAASNALSTAKAQPFNPGPGYGSLLKPFGLDDFAVDPGYAFRKQQGMEGIENSAAARGMQLSGSNLKDLARFNSGLASQEYGNAFSRDNTNKSRTYNMLSGVSGQGQGAASQQASIGQAVGNNLSDIALQAGNARSAGIAGAGNAIQSALGGASDYLMLKQLLRAPGKV